MIKVMQVPGRKNQIQNVQKKHKSQPTPISVLLPNGIHQQFLVYFPRSMSHTDKQFKKKLPKENYLKFKKSFY